VGVTQAHLKGRQALGRAWRRLGFGAHET
jgi:hypothetical protein